MDSDRSPRSLARNRWTDWSFAWPWVLGFGLTVYLGLEGGGFDVLVTGQVGVAAWWILLFAVAVGALPRRAPTTVAWCALAVLGAFVVWTALSLSWSESTERTATDLARVLTYLGVFAAAVFSRGRGGLRHAVAAVGAGVTLVAAIGLLSRLHPAWFPAAVQTAEFVEVGRERLSYPLNYWNGLAALIAVGAPAVLCMASGERRLALRGLAAAALPALALTAFFTLSRGGIAAIALAIALFLALAPDRLPKALSLLLPAAGAALLIGYAAARGSLIHGDATALAHTQGDEVLLATVLVCAAVGVLHVLATAALRRGERPAWSQVSRRHSQVALAAIAAVIVIAALAAGAPGKLSHGWHNFQQPKTEPGAGASRLTSFSGESRYQFWSSAVREFESKPLTGTGSGAFALWWTRDGSVAEDVVDTHSLYLQTLGELGLVGLALLAAFIALCLGGGFGRLRRAAPAVRPAAAAALAGASALWVTSVIDWTWKLPVIPIATLVLLAALLTEDGTKQREGADEREGGRWRLKPALRVVAVPVAIAAIVAIAIPLASTSLIRASQSEASEGNLQAAFDDARSAQDVQPDAGLPRLQQALVLEQAGALGEAAAAATAAADREPNNWRVWLVLSRLEAERGNAAAAVSAYRSARDLNPHGQIFSEGQ